MTNYELFLTFTERLTRADKARKALEEAVGNPIDNDLFCFNDFADQMLVLFFPRSAGYTQFKEDFWSMVIEGGFCCYDDDDNEIVVDTWEKFYDFWAELL